MNHRGSKCAVTFGRDHHFIVTDCEVIFLEKINEDVTANSRTLSAQGNLIEVRKWFFGIQYRCTEGAKGKELRIVSDHCSHSVGCGLDVTDQVTNSVVDTEGTVGEVRHVL